MIFAAGYGTRLQPLTNTLPKALAPLNGEPLLKHIILKLQKEKINEFIINVHHFSQKVIEYLKYNNNFGSKIYISDETDKLLDTGGGLLKASKFFSENEDFIVHNVDIFSDINTEKLMQSHQKNGSLATLAVRKNENSSRLLAFDNENTLCYWENTKTGEKKTVKNSNSEMRKFAFTGIHAISQSIFKKIEFSGCFSIIDLYLNLAKTYKISCTEFEPKYFFDVGEISMLKKAENFLG